MTCIIDQCEKISHCRGLCTKHYTRFLKSGDPLVIGRKGPKPQLAEDRFWCKVREAYPEELSPNGFSGCWIWTAQKNPAGYGQFRVNEPRRMVQAHRFSYEFIVGKIQDGLCLDHLCRNPECVNPLHLEPVTNRENILRGEGPSARYSKRTHCEYGHAFDADNTYISPDGIRKCRTCHRLLEQRRRRAVIS